jgi:hypothetical protein
MIYFMMFIVALVLTILISGYVLYTLSFVGIPYLEFMHSHRPYSFILLILLWAASLFIYSMETESPLSVRWELFFYFLSLLLVCTGIGAFVVLPYLLWYKAKHINQTPTLRSKNYFISSFFPFFRVLISFSTGFGI